MASKKSDFLSFWFYPPTPSKGVGVLLVRKFSESFRMFRKKFGMIRNFPKDSENSSGKYGNFPNRAEIFRKNEHIFRITRKFSECQEKTGEIKRFFRKFSECSEMSEMDKVIRVPHEKK